MKLLSNTDKIVVVQLEDGVVLRIFEDRMEMRKKGRKEKKSFHYADLLLMNEVLNEVVKKHGTYSVC